MHAGGFARAWKIPPVRGRSTSTGQTLTRATRAAATVARHEGSPPPHPGAARPAAAVPGGLLLGRYRPSQRLGAGSFGIVWLALDEHLGREVAIKVIPRERIAGGRFTREARTAARLAHPAVVTLYEAAVDEDNAYLVSELVRGMTLARLHADHRLSDRDAAAICWALCGGLAHAHERQVVHRDVKPANVLVPESPASEASLAKLTDFGVARVVGAESLTLTGDVVGTQAYMAPEQAAGTEAGPAADVFSLGVVLHELLTGRNPLVEAQARRGRQAGRVASLGHARPDLPPDLAAAVDAALDPAPAHRPTPSQLQPVLARAQADLDDDLRGLAHVPAVRPRRPAPAPAPPAAELPPPNPARSPVGAEPVELPVRAPHLPARALAALCAALLAGWVCRELLGGAPLAPVSAALLAGAAVALLPRIAWLTLALALLVLSVGADRAGDGVLLLLAMAIPPLLMPWRGRLWSVPLLAPALGLAGLGLGLAGLAGAWPALAGRFRGPATRAALGAAGWLCLLLVGALHGQGGLLLPSPPGMRAPGSFAASPAAVLDGVLRPLVLSGAVLPAAVWALAALSLPWLVRGRRLGADLVPALVWATATAACTAAAASAAGDFASFSGTDAFLVGSVAAGLGALAPALRRAGRGTERMPGAPVA